MNQVVEFFKHLFDTSDWPPRWHCGKWSEFHGWLYIISDLLIWAAYFTIPFVILRFINRKKSIQFTKLYFLFAAFILACGATHFLDAIAFWIPAYRLSALVRFITGILSWLTVFSLIKYLPAIFSLRSQSDLEAEIEERKKTELALKKSRKDYELLVNGVKDYAIIMLDAEGKVASWNGGAENIKGYKAAEIMGQPIDVFYTAKHLQEQEPQKNLQQALLHGRFEIEGWRVRKDGSLFWADVVYTSLYDEDNQFYGYVKVTKDITEKRKAEEKLQEFELFFNNSNDFSAIANTEGYFEINNLSFNNILGYTHNELTTKPFIEFVHPEDVEATLEAYNQLKSGATLIHFINRYLKKNGDYLWFDWYATPNLVTGKLYCIARDITERKKAEDALKKSNEEMEAFSYSVSHDLRAPLRSIIGFTTILEEEYSSKLDDEAKRLTAVIKKNTGKMSSLIDDLLSFSQLGRQSLIKVKVNCNAIINEIIRDLGINSNNKKISLIIPVLPLVKADPNTIKQVWTNLVSNAVKYSHKREHPVIEIGSIAGDHEIIFFIKDNGVGFDARYKDKLFKVFQRLHGAAEFEGTGVGLAIVEKIITRHGGRVWADSTLGEEAIFYFSLPVNPV